VSLADIFTCGAGGLFAASLKIQAIIYLTTGWLLMIWNRKELTVSTVDVGSG